ncbi:BEN domain-containing protein 5 isoform X2 [Callorhinchus milii]|nr:BEN domain-containing protein 5 isoform X2 [Callorhinchus milii]
MVTRWRPRHPLPAQNYSNRPDVYSQTRERERERERAQQHKAGGDPMGQNKTDSREELEKFLKLKRYKIIDNFIEESESDDGDHTEDEPHQFFGIQEQDVMCFEDSSDDDDHTLRIFDELKNKYSCVKANNKRLIQELKKVKTKLHFAEERQKEYEHMASELQRLRDLNMDLQNALLLKLFRLPEQYHGSNPEEELIEHAATDRLISSTPVTSILQDHFNMQQRAYGCKKSPHVLPTPSTSNHLESQLENGNIMVPCSWGSTQAIAVAQPNVYAVQDGKVHIGANIWIDEDKWETVKRQPSDSRFTKCLAVAVWGVETLKDRSVTGIACNSTKSSPKPPLSPYKVQVIKEQLLNRIRQDAKDDNEIHKRLNKVNRYIGEKIMDINKQWRKAKADLSKFRNCECEMGLKCETHADCERSEVPIKEEIETFIYE